jgi:putative peptidoglycan lipid II flippase
MFLKKLPKGLINIVLKGRCMNGQSQSLVNLWKNLTSGSINRLIFGAAIKVAILTALVKIMAVSKELLVAQRFGIGDALDAFLIAFLVPSFIINVLAGSLSASLIPTYIRVKEQEGIKAAQKLFSGATLWSLILLLIATVLIVAAAPLYLSWIAKGFSPEKLHLTFQLLCAIAPLVLIDGFIIIWGAVLNAGERFALVGITPIVTPAITIVLLLGFESSMNSFILVAGLLSGALIEMILLGAALKRQGFSLIPRWYGFNSHLRHVAAQYIPMMAGMLLMTSTTLVDQSMAAMLSPGSVAALNYGNRVIALPLTLATTALSTAVVPYFSKMVASEDWRQVDRTLQRYLSLIFITAIPLTGLLILFSQSIIQILFQRGSFSVNDTHVVAQIQSCFSLQIPFYIAGILIVRLISAIRANQVLMYGSAISVIVNVVFNYLFMQQIGIAGIALSTSCVYAISFSFLILFWWRYSRKLFI